MRVLVGVFMLMGLMAGSVFSAGELETDMDCKALAESFMKQVDVGEFDKAFALVKPHWPIAESRFKEVMGQTKAQLPKVGAAYGGRVEPGIELVRVSRVGASFVRFMFLQRFDKSAARWEIVFYHGGANWYVNRVVWNDKTYELFKDDE